MGDLRLFQPPWFGVSVSRMDEIIFHRWRRARGTGSSTYSNRARGVLVKVELATGGSALLCGSLLAFRPDGSLMGLPTRVLAGGPFADWRLPGLLLAGFVGVGYLAAGAWERQRCPHGRELSMVAGAGLVVFEAVEWRWLGFHPLQAVFMAVGAGVVGLAVSAGTTVGTGWSADRVTS
jgi:hypothetical protein